MKSRLLALLLITFFASASSAQTDGGTFTFNITSPENIAGAYDWGGSQDWGGEVLEDFCGELVWAGSVDNLGCEVIDADLSGKIALIRRGTCDFSLKAYHAQAAGAMGVLIVNHNDDENGPAAIVTMLGGDSATAVTIPAIFTSYNTSLLISSEIEDGPVEICLTFPRISNAVGPYSYFTPQSQIVSMDNMQVTIHNRGRAVETGVETLLEITNPSGAIETLSVVHDVAPEESFDVAFDSYVPSEMGEYQMKFISGIDGLTIERKFEITEFMWGMDNGNISRAIGPGEELFATSNFEYQHGNLVLAGADGIATHLTFGIGNGADLFTNDEGQDLVLTAIYDGDKNKDGQIDEISDFVSLGNPLEIGFYTLTGEETFDNLISVPFDAPVALTAGGIYYVSVQYSGADAATGVGPTFSATSQVDYLNFPSTLLQLDDVYSGWSGATIVSRLQLEGAIMSSVENFKPLSKDKLTIFSNPVQNGNLRFSLELESTSETIDLMVRNIEGKLMRQLRYTDSSVLNEDIDIKDFTPGTYFLNINTEEGFISRKIIVVE